ncbi:MAG TPA: hypothetical protein PKW07_03210 [Syntrophorhabdaceae bacterium]|nr:hypothetical protein [Syntrophorhabdaceae bacterium]
MKFRVKVFDSDKAPNNIVHEDRVLISDDGKKMLMERIGESMAERLRRHDNEGNDIQDFNSR